ncbi:MAG: energy transducer TonB [Salibacteraceae bacterium]
MNPKSDFANLEKKRTRFFLTGLVFACSLTLLAFEWRAPLDPFNDDLANMANLELDEEELHPITYTNVEKPKPIFKPKVSTQVITQPVEVTVMTQITTTTDPVIDDFNMASMDDELLFGAEPTFVDDRDNIFVPVEEMPQYPGGEKALYAFLAKHLKYPAIAREAGIQGTVFIQFIIDKDGNVTKVTTARGKNVYLDKEAERVVKMFPKWSPGKQRNNPVPVGIRIPVKFKLKN